jgi:hypothetical protein
MANELKAILNIKSSFLRIYNIVCRYSKTLANVLTLRIEGSVTNGTSGTGNRNRTGGENQAQRG